MAKIASKETTIKPPKRLFNGKEDGVKFSKDYQPSPESKKLGWEELRKQRHLTQSIIKEMLGEDGIKTKTFEGYIKSLINNAKIGNAKAIDTINKALEEEVTKIEQTNINYNSVEMTKEEINKISDALDTKY